MDPNQAGYKGFKDYTRRMLRIYDPWVLGVMAPRVWKMGSEPGLDLYRQHMGHRHLDVGPGTGYFIAESDPPGDIELTLLDANPDVLEFCAERLASWNPTTVEGNVLEPLKVDGPYDSAALAHVIHCLPAPLENKARAVRHVADVLTDDGRLFGGTVLGFDADHGWAARAFLRIANLQGGFDNRDDDMDSIHSMLSASFHEVEIDVPAGSVAYFTASRPRRPA